MYADDTRRRARVHLTLFFSLLFRFFLCFQSTDPEYDDFLFFGEGMNLTTKDQKRALSLVVERIYIYIKTKRWWWKKKKRRKAMAFDPRSRSDERAHSAIDILISWDNFIVTIQNGGGPGAADAETLFQSDCYICICGDEKRRRRRRKKRKVKREWKRR